MMVKDIVERLRAFHAEIVASDGGESDQMKMMRDAADEIERLRERLAQATEDDTKMWNDINSQSQHRRGNKPE